MPLRYLPRDHSFWILHCGLCLIFFLITVATVRLWSDHPSYDIASAAVWLPTFTLAMLGFRWLYLRRRWHTLGSLSLVGLTLVFSATAGLLIAASVTACVLPFFWDRLAATGTAGAMAFDASGYVVRIIVGNALQAQLFVGGWAFLYVGVATSGRARKAELHGLRLENSLREAQLDTLANQLNPHFLFNALNNIRFMVHEDVQRAEAMIVALSNILRYSLECTHHVTVSLREELAIVEEFLALMQIQLEGRLNVSLNVDDALHQCRVPPMILQLLVENAIKHGLEPLHLGGQLMVEVEQQASLLSMKVSNDAPAVPSDSGGLESSSLGVGLKNIERRLRLLYGDSSSVQITRGARNFTVQLQFPCEMQ